MAKTENGLDTQMYDLELGENSHGDEPSDSASSNLLRDMDRPSLEIDTSTEDEGTACRRNMRPKHLICLTIGTGGLQVIWTAILAQGSPYLSSLGLPLHIVSLIWLAGPLSGVLVQPYVSVLSDRSRSSWGRRRPFILVGTIFTILFMCLLPWSAEIVHELLCDTEAAVLVTKILAATLILGLNIAVQPLQMGIRALMVDACPPHQQVQAVAYASCITGVGSILGYSSGFMKLPLLLPWFGNTQFKCLSAIASLALGSTVAVTLVTIKEKKVVFEGAGTNTGVGIVGVFKQVLKSAKLMSGDMKRVCKVQFFAWMGWFPFLFYITTYIGGLYEADILARSMDDVSTQFMTHLRSDGIRKGTLCMVLFAIVALISNIFLPLIVSSSRPKISTSVIQLNHISPVASKSTTRRDQMASSSSRDEILPRSLGASRMLRRLSSLTWLTLPRAWGASNIFTSLILLSTCLTSSPTPSILLVSLLGISWALTQWAPLALINASLAAKQSYRTDGTPKQSDGLLDDYSESTLEGASPSDGEFPSNKNWAAEEEDLVVVPGGLEAGAVMGVYNAAIAAPQLFAAIGSSGMFWVLTKAGWEDNEAVGWVIRIGGLAGLIAAWLTLGIEKDENYD